MSKEPCLVEDATALDSCSRPLFLYHFIPCDLMYLSLCDWPQQMNKAIIPTSPPRPVCARTQNMLHCHQSGAQKEQASTPLASPNLSRTKHSLKYTVGGMGNIQVNDQGLSMSCKPELLDVSQWKLCCGQTESQSCKDICQDVCPFHSRLAAVALKMLISSVWAQWNVLHFQGMLTAVFTFPFVH